MADLRIRAQDQVRISNASAELRVQGDVSVIRDTGGLRFRGTVEVPQGRVPLFNNDFAIVEGTLDFSRRPVEPEIDIVAVTEVPISDPSGNFGRELERITVYLTGTFSEPTVRFESENGLDEQAILRLLAGFDLNDTAQGAATAGLRDVGLRAGLNFLERALATQIVGIDTIDIETQEAGLDQMGGTRIAVGKYLSNSLYLRYAQGLSVTERDIFLEYQISRRTLFTSELKRRLRENGAENEFNLDFKFRVKY
jgi:autotransporter translocation and assembly factor TamB